MITQILFNIDSNVKKRAVARAKREGITLSSMLQLTAKAYADEKFDVGIVERPEIPNAKSRKRT